jgi:hypothetical protein
MVNWGVAAGPSQFTIYLLFAISLLPHPGFLIAAQMNYNRVLNFAEVTNHAST